MSSTGRVLFVGSGAFENAWAPVLEAVRNFTAKPVKFDPSNLNLVMSRLVFEHQALALICSARPDAPRAKESFIKSENNLNRFHRILCTSLNEFSLSGKTRLNPSQIHLIRNLASNDGSFSVLTTNWTTKEFAALGDCDVLPIHGDSSNPDSIYLPLMKSQDRHVEDRPNTHGNQYLGAYRRLGEAKELVIWGLGFNPLDAELTLLFTETFNHRDWPSSIKVVDKDPEKVIEKLLLFDAPIDSIEAITV